MVPNPASAIVVIAGDDVYEDLFGASLELQSILGDAGFATRVAFGMKRFASDEVKAKHDELIVLYTAMGEFTPDQQRGLAQRVSAGAGLLAVHASNVFGATADGSLAASYSNAFELIGSRYTSHGPQPHESRFTVHASRTNPVTAAVTDFDITHEHYRLETATGLEVVAWRDTPDGREPLAYVRESGAGRVAYVQLGHDMRAWDEPGVRAMIRNAAAWVVRRTHDEDPKLTHRKDA
jgi:type 1 glutamine amidotransferase